jgi:hypothetical protein
VPCARSGARPCGLRGAKRRKCVKPRARWRMQRSTHAAVPEHRQPVVMAADVARVRLGCRVMGKSRPSQGRLHAPSHGPAASAKSQSSLQASSHRAGWLHWGQCMGASCMGASCWTWRMRPCAWRVHGRSTNPDPAHQHGVVAISMHAGQPAALSSVSSPLTAPLARTRATHTRRRARIAHTRSTTRKPAPRTDVACASHNSSLLSCLQKSRRPLQG